MASTKSLAKRQKEGKEGSLKENPKITPQKCKHLRRTDLVHANLKVLYKV